MIEYLTRATWGAGPVTVGHAISLDNFVGLVVHHTVIILPDYDHDGMTAGDHDDVIRYMRQLQHARPDLGDDVPYSFVVFEGEKEHDAIVAEGRGFGRSGAHTIGYNSTRYGCAFAGDFTNHAPTDGMWSGIGWVGSKLVDPRAPVAQPTLEHRDVYATACPGDATPRTAPSVAQPPFRVTPEPVPQPIGELVRATYVRRISNPQVHVLFDNGVARPVENFADVEEIYKNTLKTEFVTYSATEDVTDMHGNTRKVWVLSEPAAESAALPK